MPPDANAPVQIEMGQQPATGPPTVEDLMVRRPLNFRPGEDRGEPPPRFIAQGFRETLPGMAVEAALTGKFPERPEDFTWVENALTTIISIGGDPTFLAMGGAGNIAARQAAKTGARTLLGGVGRTAGQKILGRTVGLATTLGGHSALGSVLRQEVETGKVDSLEVLKDFGSGAFSGTTAALGGSVPGPGLVKFAGEILGFSASAAWQDGRPIPTLKEIEESAVTLVGIKLAHASAAGIHRLATGKKVLTGEQRQIQKQITPEQRLQIVAAAVDKANLRALNDFIANPSRKNAEKLRINLPRGPNQGARRLELAIILSKMTRKAAQASAPKPKRAPEDIVDPIATVPPTAKPAPPKPQAPPKPEAEKGGEKGAAPVLSYEEFRAEMERLFKESSKYTIDQVGSGTFTDKMAELADKYPEFDRRLDNEPPKSEAEKVKEVEQPESAAKQKARKSLDAAIGELFSETSSLSANPYLNPKVYAKAAKVVREYIRFGAISFSEMIADLKGKIGDKVVAKMHDALKVAWDDLNATGSTSGESSIKNAVVDQERAKRGLPPAMEVARQSDKQSWDEAMRIRDRDPFRQDALIAELKVTPRAHTPVEVALLTHRMVELKNEEAKVLDRLELAQRAGDESEIAEHESIWSLHKEQLRQLFDVTKATGREAGRSLRARKMIVAEDFSLVKMLADKRAAKGVDELAKADEVAVRGRQRQLSDLEKRQEERTASVDEVQAEQASKIAIGKIVKAKPEKPAKNAERPKAKNLENDAAISNYAKKLAKYFVEQGVTEREKIIDAVHEVLSEAVPDISRRQTMDAISGYGDYRPLSKDELDVVLRQAKGEMQQIAKLEDMQAGQAPLKTGVERRTPSDEERRLIKQVNEMKRRGGFVVTDPETQLRTAQEATKTRLRNQIADLEAQIKSREKIVKSKTKAEPDAETRELMKQRDTLKEQFEDIFGKGGMSDAERDARTLAALKKRLRGRIEDYETRLREKDFAPQPRKKPKFDKEAEKLRYEIEVLKAKILSGYEADLRARRTKVQKVIGTVPELMNLQRTLRVSMDLSAMLRQGKILWWSHPLLSAKAVPIMFRSAWSKEKASRHAHELDQRPNADFRRRSDVEMTELEGALHRREEGYMSRWAKMVPGVAASERGFVAYLNQVRADAFDLFAANLSRNGTMSDVEGKVIGNLINVVTSRGPMGKFKTAAVAAATVFWAPRHVLSRFQYLSLQPLFWKAGHTARTRKLVAMEYSRALLGAGVYYSLVSAGLYALFGPPGEDKKWDIELDSLSSDFGKIRIGDIRIDPLGGLTQVWVFMNRFLRGETKQIVSGEVVPLRGEGVPYGGQDTGSMTWRFIRSKFSPSVGTVLNIFAGENLAFEKVTPITTARDLVVPLSMVDIRKNMKSVGVPATTSLWLLEFFGEGVQNFEGSQEKRKEFKKDRVRTYSKRLGPMPEFENTKTARASEKSDAWKERRAEAIQWFTKQGLKPRDLKREYMREYDRGITRAKTTAGRKRQREARRKHLNAFNRNARKIGR